MNPTKRSISNRLGALEDRHDDDSGIYVVAIGGDPDRPRGWLSREEYREAYGDPGDLTEVSTHFSSSDPPVGDSSTGGEP